MKVTHQEKTCANCNNKFLAKVNRFSVCNCGCTDTVDTNERYGTLDADNLCLTVIRHNIPKYFSLNSDEFYYMVIPELYGLPIIDGKNTKKQLLSILTPEEIIPGLEKTKAWILLSHYVHLTHSKLYRALFNNGLFNFCKSIIFDAIAKDAPEEKIADIVEKCRKFPSEMPVDNIGFALDAFIDGYPIPVAELLAHCKVETYDFDELQHYAQLSVDKTCRDLSEYSLLSYYGSELVSKVRDYYHAINWFKNEYKDISPIKAFINSGDPIYTRHFLIKNTMRILKLNGVYAIHKILEQYDSEEDEYNKPIAMLDGMLMREATKEEVQSCGLMMCVPTEGIDRKPYVIICNNVIESIVMQSSTHGIMIEGNCSDRHKKLANKFLDTLEREVH